MRQPELEMVLARSRVSIWSQNTSSLLGILGDSSVQTRVHELSDFFFHTRTYKAASVDSFKQFWQLGPALHNHGC